MSLSAPLPEPGAAPAALAETVADAPVARRSQRIRMLIVDDSAFVRKIVREMLTRSNPFIEVVGVARDGEEALEMVAGLDPDVVTCDLVMPRVDGLNFVRQQMMRRPVPIVILSASPQDGGLVLEALAAGAVDFVRKPTALATEQLLDIREELVAKVKAAVRAPLRNLVQPPPAASPAPAPVPARADRPLKVDLVVIGVSTGGPQALRRLIPQFPADFPVPIAMVLHMPVGYTALFAEKLDEISELEVAEAAAGTKLRPGLALLAPAGRHVFIVRDESGGFEVQLSVQPIEKVHRPSVDVLFQSAAEAARERVLGIVMTGMGDDGKQGAAWIKAQGGTILTESEESCVIYGMPRSVDEAGLSDASVPLDRLAREIFERI